MAEKCPICDVETIKVSGGHWCRTCNTLWKDIKNVSPEDAKPRNIMRDFFISDFINGRGEYRILIGLEKYHYEKRLLLIKHLKELGYIENEDDIIDGKDLTEILKKALEYNRKGKKPIIIFDEAANFRRMNWRGKRGPE